MSAKERTISSIYYSVSGGFGSIADTLRRAKEVDVSITRADVKRFLDKQAVRQRKKPRRYNSYVPAGRLEQIQIDLADFGKARARFRYGLVAIDSFTKHLAVIPINNKTSATTAGVLDLVIERVGMPATALTDEGGEFQAAFAERLDFYEIDHVVTRTPPIFVERVIRTIKEHLESRMVAMNTRAWHTMIDAVVTKYNDDIHTAIKMTPLQATLLENQWAVKMNIMARAKRNRVYPDLKTGDNVKVIRKPGKYAEFKAGFVNWTEDVYKIESIAYEHGARMHKLEGRERPLLRHELLKVEGAERPPLIRVPRKARADELFRRMVGE